jgi:hypothetical protein
VGAFCILDRPHVTSYPEKRRRFSTAFVWRADAFITGLSNVYTFYLTRGTVCVRDR